MTKEQRLAEREKELACIYSICLIAAGAPDPEAAARGVARALCAAVQHEAAAECSVELSLKGSGRTVSVRRARGKDRPRAGGRPAGLARDRIEARLPDDSSGGWSGTIRMEYRDPELRFLPQERALLDSVVAVLASILRTAALISALQATGDDLAAKNVALREVLHSIEDERKLMLESFRGRLLTEIAPLAERARDPSISKERRRAYLDLLVDELGREAASLGPGAPSYASLSPREREVAVQVRNGRTSKEIAGLLGIAEATVERHRHNMRRKLGIADRSANLAGALEASAAPARRGDLDL